MGQKAIVNLASIRKEHFTIIMFKNGKSFTVYNAGKSTMSPDGLTYQLPHRDGVARFNAQEVLYVTQWRQSNRPTKVKAIGEDFY